MKLKGKNKCKLLTKFQMRAIIICVRRDRVWKSGKTAGCC